MNKENDFKYLIDKYPNRVPVIIKTSPNIELKKTKYLVPRQLNLFEFKNLIRSNLGNLKEHESIFLFINEKIFLPAKHMGEIWQEEKLGDCLYIYISKENTFG